MTSAQRAAYFAAGRVTIGRVTTFIKSRRAFKDWFVGKLHGHIVVDRRGHWKHHTEDAARAAAIWYKRMSARVAGIAQ